MTDGPNIAVYSGSFNPLHIGHLAIIRYMVEVAGFDMVYLIVSPKNPLKDSISSDSGIDRYNAAVRAVNRHFGPHAATATSAMPKVQVDDIELNMPEPHYTIKTLDALREREPGKNFTLIMGADNLADIRRWKDHSRILAEYGAAVYPREGFDLKTIRQDLLNEDPAYNIQIINAPMVNISSTEIRKALSEGKDVSHLLM